MGDPEQLFALLELMLRTFSSAQVPEVNIAGGCQTNVKAGGHSEDMFVHLSEEEREEFECSICYQILKDSRQCENKHNFCYGCICVWSTSGNPSNHHRCPVCRVHGGYVTNPQLDDLINSKRTKCLLKTCSWTGPLNEHASHKHTTYNEGPAEKSDFPFSNFVARSTVRSSISNSKQTPRGASTSRSNANASRQPLTSTSNNTRTSQTSQPPSNQRASVTSQNSGSTATSRVRSRSRPRQNSTSVQRRNSNASTNNSQGRLTSRARIQNGVTANPTSTSTNNNTNSNNNQQETQNENVDPTTRRSLQSSFTPRPPITPRPQRQGSRRVPTLPSLVNSNDNASNNTDTDNNTNPVSSRSANTVNSSVSEINNNQTNGHNNNTTNAEPQSPGSPTVAEPVMRFTIEPVYIRRGAVRPNPNRGFTTIRDRLNESRQRLDLLMNAFSSELDRGRNDLTSFQDERERRRQQQLAEVRDLGRRLGHVAQELRGLLSQRREIRSQIDHLADSVSDDMD